MPGTKTGVYPVYENQFQVGASEEELHDIADMVSFSVALDNTVEEWNPFDQKGWIRRLMTAKSITITVSGKRNYGDAGNDYVAGLALKNGRDAEGCLQWTFPDGATLLFENAVFNVTNWGGGDSTTVIPLEFDVMSNGKPTYTEASEPTSLQNDEN
jgi:conserved domain protein